MKGRREKEALQKYRGGRVIIKRPVEGKGGLKNHAQVKTYNGDNKLRSRDIEQKTT